jgi:hypothetical protein
MKKRNMLTFTLSHVGERMKMSVQVLEPVILLIVVQLLDFLVCQRFPFREKEGRTLSSRRALSTV